jgi:ribose transport system ATP-binding protein
MDDYALELSGISKRYGANEALKGVDLKITPGEVHALLGKNGAGKSTLIKVISGAETPDVGVVRVRGARAELGSPSRAKELGVAVVHQELSLVPQMTIAENIQLGTWAGKHGLLDRAGVRRAARPLMDRVGLSRDPDTRVDSLGMAERQLVEIAKALAGDVHVLLLDEPTSSLSDREAERLFALVRQLRSAGVAVIYVSHRLSEVLALCDRVSILRDGQIEPPIASASATERQLAALMVGEPRVCAHPGDTVVEASVSNSIGAVDHEAEAVLVVENLCVAPRLKDISLELRPGELVAVFGLMGAGRTRLARALFGLEKWTSGSARLSGRGYAPTATREAIDRGIGFVGEDRSAGLVPKMSVTENIVLGSLGSFRKKGQWDQAAARAVADGLVSRLAIKTLSPDYPVNSLSGGNQQKVLLARWLCTGAQVLILDDPVRGVDVGAKDEIFEELRSYVQAGGAVLYFTSDAAEAQDLGSRILIMSSGRLVAELPAGSPEDEIVAAAGGVHV